MKHMKITLVSLYIIGLGGTVWFIIIVNKVIDFQIGTYNTKHDNSSECYCIDAIVYYF